jgi:hypothetical protein
MKTNRYAPARFLRIAAALLITVFVTQAIHAAQPKAEAWREFRNIEMMEYCLSLPLEGYVRDDKKSDVKGKYVFVHRDRKKGDITLWGLDNAYSKAPLEVYVKRYYAKAEEQGQVIEERKLDAAARRFHAWGYWSNRIYESRFLEIVWLREQEVVKFYATFPVADVNIWKARLPQLLKQSSLCG